MAEAARGAEVASPVARAVVEGAEPITEAADAAEAAGAGGATVSPQANVVAPGAGPTFNPTAAARTGALDRLDAAAAQRLAADPALARNAALERLEQRQAQLQAAGIENPESPLESLQHLTQPKPPVLGPNGPIDPVLLHQAPTPPPGIAPPPSMVEAAGVEAPTTMADAAEHIASRITEQPGIARQVLANTPAALISRAGRATENLVQGAVDEIFGKGISATPAGRVLTSAVKLGASGAAEMGLIAAGNEVSEDTLGDHEINAQKLLYAVEHGMLVGAATGGLLGAGGSSAREIINKFAPKINELAEVAAYKALGAGGGRGNIERDLLREYGPGTKANMSPTEVFSMVGRLSLKMGIPDGAADIETQYNRIVDAKNNIVGKSLEDLIPGDVQVSKSELYNRAFASKEGSVGHDFIQDLKQNREAHGNIAGITDEEAAEAKTLADKIKGEYSMNVVEALRKKEELGEYYRMLKAPEDVRAQALARYHQAALESEDALNLRRAAQTRVSELAGATENSMLQKELNGIEKIFGPDGRASVSALRAERMRIDGLIKTWRKSSNMAPELPARQLLLQHLRGAMEDMIVDAGEKTEGMGKLWVDKYRAVKKDYHLLSYMQKKAEGSMAAHARNQGFSLTSKMLGAAEFMHAGAMAIPKAAAMMAAHKLFRDRGMAASATVLDKLGQMALIQRTAAQVDRQVEEATESLLTRIRKGKTGRVRFRTLGKSPEGPEDHLESREENRKKIEYVASLANAPNVAKEHAAIALGGTTTYAPKTAASLASRANVVTQYLIAQLPKGHDSLSDITGSEPSRLSDAELRTFGNKFEGATALKPTLRKLATGHLTPDHILALKTAAPDVYNQIVSNLIKGIADMPADVRRKIPMQQQMELSIITGQPMSWATQPSSISLFQANDISVSQSDGRPAQGQQAPGRPGKMKSTMAKQTQSASDSLDSQGGLIGPRTQEH